ncbi:MAG: hypothetical protein ACFCU6_04610 [Balneolaceae bacterium]
MKCKTKKEKTMINLNKRPYFATMILIMPMLIVSCSDSLSGEEAIPDVPAFPSFEAADLTGEFAMARTAGATEDTTDTAFSEALGLMEESLRILTTRPLQASFYFELAEETEPEFINNEFVWEVSHEFDGLQNLPEFVVPDLFLQEFTITARFVNQPADGEVEWSITSDLANIIPDSLSNFGLDTVIEKLKGFTFDGGARGEWSFSGGIIRDAVFDASRSSFENPIDQLRNNSGSSSFDREGIFGEPVLTWERVNESQRRIRIDALNISARSDAYWQFDQTNEEFHFELNNVETNSLIRILWNLETKEGFIEKDGTRRCWDENLQEADC